MAMTGRQQAWFVVADPDHDDGRFIEALQFNMNMNDVGNLVNRSREFYRTSIIPALFEKISR